MEYFGRQFKMIDQLFKFRMNKNLEKLDITFAQMHVLIYLEQHEGEKVTQKILSEEFKVKHSTMSGILQRMVEKELIVITVDEDNKKYKNITKTKKADKIRTEIKKYRDYTESVVLKDFSTKEIEILSKLLERVYDNLKNDCPLTYENKDLKGDKK